MAIGGGTGAGAATAAQFLVARGVTALVSFGLAGGLDPALRPGDLVIPERVLVDAEAFLTDVALSRRLAAAGATCAAIVASPTVVADAAGKQRLWRATGAAAVDMESGAVARAAAAAGVPFTVLRAICDPAERSLPPAALLALDHVGGIGLFRVLVSVLRRPGQIPALLALARDAATARRSLLALARKNPAGRE